MSEKFRFKSNKEKNRIKLFSNNDFFDPTIMQGARIEMFSNRQIIIEGCLGVFEYSEDFIRLNIGKGSLILFGSGFDISLFEGKTITIRGSISSLEFCI